MNKKVAFQGIEGSFSHLTGQKEFGTESTFIGVRDFGSLFAKVSHGDAHVGVVPIENSLAGSVYENYDWLERYDLTIIGESYTKVEHCLLATHVPNISADERILLIQKVFSHFKALEQCTRLFSSYPYLQAVIHFDTAGAAKDVAISRNPAHAAIASSYAAELYGLEVLKSGIQDESNNFTRFIFVTKNSEVNEHRMNKCSLSFTLPHQPGTLNQVMEIVAKDQWNVTKIQSRPLQQRPFEYIFYMDLEFNEKSYQEVMEIIKKIKSKTENLKILGIYRGGKP